MTEFDQRKKRNLGLAIVGLLCAWFAWEVRSVLNPLLLAYILAFIVHPFVLKLEGRGWSRKRAVNTIYLLAMALGLMFTVAFWNQGSNLFQRVLDHTRGQEAGLFTNLDRRFGELLDEHEDSGWVAWLTAEGSDLEESSAEVPGGDPAGSLIGDGETVKPDIDGPPAGSEASASKPPVEGLAPGPVDETVVAGDTLYLLPALQRVWNEAILGSDFSMAGTAAKRGVDLASAIFGSMLGLISMLVLLPMYTWFLLFDLEKIHRFVRSYFPENERKRFTDVGRKIGEVISSFFRGQLLVCFLKGLSIAIGLYLAGIPYALFLGLTAGFAALIPFFGASMAAVFTFLVGLLGPVGAVEQSVEFVPHLVRILVVFGVAELLEGYVFVPRIIGGSLGLNPLVVLVSVFAGGAALGMFGFLIALPLTATLVILAKELVLPALREWADEDPDSRNSDSV
ncbi:MAG: AI-2E family transporter [Planctomycetes bacterium]|nr:AI-2E family transporter [Planctomycetota bacterium]